MGEHRDGLRHGRGMLTCAVCPDVHHRPCVCACFVCRAEEKFWFLPMRYNFRDHYVID
jgi:hypothetical protein